MPYRLETTVGSRGSFALFSMSRYIHYVRTLGSLQFLCLLLAFSGCGQQSETDDGCRLLAIVPEDVTPRWIRFTRDGKVVAYVAGSDKGDRVVVNEQRGPLFKLA